VSRAAAAALLGVALTLVAGSFDSPSLYVPGVALLALGLGSAAWVALAAAGARVERTLGPHQVEEDEPWPLGLSFATGVLPPPGGELQEPLLPRALAVGWRRGRRAVVHVRFARRGRRTLPPPRVVLRDPLGLAERELAPCPAGEILVLPRIEPVTAPGGGDAAALAALARPQAGADEVEVDGLRPYREGAPAARIHWPTVARRGELVERRLVAERSARPLVVLDARGAPDGEALDMAVRAAGSLTVALARAGGCGLLLPGDRRPVEVEPDLRAWPALHVRLALVAADGRTPAAGRLARAGAVLWVAPTRGARLPAGLARAGGARYLVAPGDPARGRPAFAVAGCTGVALGRASVAHAAGEAA
jgi:uncharacterized protein (DUF58 family)